MITFASDGLSVEVERVSLGTPNATATLTGALALRYEASGLNNGSEYTYRVAGFAHGLTTPYSAVTNLIPMATPALALNHQSAGTISIAWSHVAGVYVYALERKTGNGSFVMIEPMIQSGDTTYEDTAISEDEVYAYRIRAINKYDQETPHSNEVIAHADDALIEFSVALVTSNLLIGTTAISMKIDNDTSNPISNIDLYRREVGETHSVRAMAGGAFAAQQVKSEIDINIAAGRLYFYDMSLPAESEHLRGNEARRIEALAQPNFEVSVGNDFNRLEIFYGLGADGFRIVRAVNNVTTTVATLSAVIDSIFYDVNVAPDDTYYYELESTNSYGEMFSTLTVDVTAALVNHTPEASSLVVAARGASEAEILITTRAYGATDHGYLGHLIVNGARTELTDSEVVETGPSVHVAGVTVTVGEGEYFQMTMHFGLGDATPSVAVPFRYANDGLLPFLVDDDVDAIGVDSAAELSWVRGNADRFGHRISWKQPRPGDGVGEDIETLLNYDASEFTVTRLNNGTPATITLVAFDAQGESAVTITVIPGIFPDPGGGDGDGGLFVIGHSSGGCSFLPIHAGGRVDPLFALLLLLSLGYIYRRRH